MLYRATIQVVNFESPLIPIKRNDAEVTVRDFVDITFYDENNNRININSLAKDERPIILYNSEYYPNLKHCFYFDEVSYNLEVDGVQTEFNYEFNETNNLKCSSEYLTSFTAGDYISNSSNSSNSKDEKIGLGHIIMVIVVVILVIVSVYLIYCEVQYNEMKRKQKNINPIEIENKNGKKNGEDNELDF